MSAFYERIYAVVREIPRGRVMSYGQVAFLAGNPRAARAVGFALHRNPAPGEIPCHRVVFRDGSVSPGFAFGGPEVQRELLRAEGVCFTEDGRVDMERFGVLRPAGDGGGACGKCTRHGLRTTLRAARPARLCAECRASLPDADPGIRHAHLRAERYDGGTPAKRNTVSRPHPDFGCGRITFFCCFFVNNAV